MKPEIQGLASYPEDHFFLIAGPCVVEDEATVMGIAETLAPLCSDLHIPLVYKASYRKANRTRADSFTGIGDKEALQVLDSVRQRFNIPVLTDIHETTDAAMASKYTDVLQIPAFLCRQTALLEAAAKTGKCINVKKGQFASPGSMQFALDKIRQAGNDRCMLTDRGTMFGYGDLVVDMRGIPAMQAFGVPVVLDATHSLQQPNRSEGVTGGQPEMIATIARAGIAAGADGLFIETHPNPGKALSDGANMLPVDKLEDILRKLLRIRQAIR